jgi:hypothetical protein
VRMRNAAFLICHLPSHSLEMRFETAKRFGNGFVIIDPAHILHCYLKTILCQVVGAHYEYFPFRGKIICSEKGIQDGRTRERKRSSLQQNG